LRNTKLGTIVSLWQHVRVTVEFSVWQQVSVVS